MADALKLRWHWCGFSVVFEEAYLPGELATLPRITTRSRRACDWTRMHQASGVLERSAPSQRTML